MPETKTRVVGSGFTTLNWMGQPIAFLDEFTDSGQDPVAQPEPVHPIGDKFPREIATARALQAGTLTLTIRELWNEPVWWQLAGVARTYDIVDVYQALAAMPSGVSAQMIIKPPGGGSWRGNTYHNLVITQIADNETVRIGSMTFPRAITAMYTNKTPLTLAGR
jgi:hypothetical protein